jgi:hypothetical protein
MSCPLNRKRFVGSGYTKEAASVSASASTLEQRMAEMLAVREAQNAGNFSARMSEPAAAAAAAQTGQHAVHATQQNSVQQR